ncbi:MAG TPA: hypothetical protein VJ830_01115, partial [Anaerolineales bacterium]|nr:hypothetical protein [Anaerolineales bacterium]
ITPSITITPYQRKEKFPIVKITGSIMYTSREISQIIPPGGMLRTLDRSWKNNINVLLLLTQSTCEKMHIVV